MGIIKKLKGKALRVVLAGLVSLACVVFGISLPEPAQQALVSGAATLVEAVTAGDDTQQEEAPDGD